MSNLPDLHITKAARPHLPLVAALLEEPTDSSLVVGIDLEIRPDIEGFTLGTSIKAPERIDVKVRAGGPAGIRRADRRLATILRQRLLVEGLEVDRPAIPHRGLMECFYGPKWTEDDRRWLLDLGAERGLNHFLYGPAADPLTGSRWHQPYSDAELRRFTKMVSYATGLGITVAYRISPCAPLEPDRGMRFSASTDVEVLYRRCRQVYEAGVEHLLVTFDDIDGSFHHAEDREALGSHPTVVASAHATTVNTLRRQMMASGADCRVTLCPNDYWGLEESAYRRELGRTLDAEIDIWWTGPQVISPRVRAHEISRVRGQYGGKRIWLWDNFPVNDWGGTPVSHGGEVSDDLLFLGPLVGREPQMAALVSGYAINGAVQAAATVPAIAAGAEWSWDPFGYDPESIWREVLVKLTGNNDFLRIAQLQRTSRLDASADASLATAVWRYLMDVDTYTESTDSAHELTDLLREIQATVTRLESTMSRLARAVSAWLSQIGGEASAGLATIELIESIRSGDDATAITSARAFRSSLPASGPGRPLVAGGALASLLMRGRNLAGGIEVLDD